uniref:NADH-ubiquinone oxidoreductase chain 5 n=1 Tax=Strigamia maritima TaxID=126957 RepID=T1JJE2_STRMM
MAAPPTINLIGELILLVALYGWCSYVLFILVIVSFFGAAYTLYLYAIFQHGDFNYFFGSDRVREHASLFFHWAPSYFFFCGGFVWGGFFLFGPWGGGGYYVNWGLFNLGGCEVGITIVIDVISLIFLSFILFISSGVMLYSEGYMLGDWYKDHRLGLVSYWLVVYYQNYRSYVAGMLTVLSNRIGDVCLLVAICLILDWGYVFILCLLAAITKGAQIPFSAWLPAAIAAPTPVSSLVHSSTLVTAGVYLLVQFQDMRGGLGSFTLISLSCATMLIAGIGANFEYDLKRMVALSTLRQVEFILFTLSLGYPYLAFFHFLCHAVYKCLLFLCAGVIIHGSCG